MNGIHILLHRYCLGKLHRPKRKAFYHMRIEEFYEYFLKNENEQNSDIVSINKPFDKTCPVGFPGLIIQIAFGFASAAE